VQIGEYEERQPQQVREPEPPHRRSETAPVDLDAARAASAQQAFQTSVYDHRYTGKGSLLSIWI
jgi:hypothetical protein